MTRNTTHRQYDDHEVNLVELAIDLWREKFIILGFGVLLLLAGTGYLMITNPTYQATLEIQQPAKGEIAALNSAFQYFNRGRSIQCRWQKW